MKKKQNSNQNRNVLRWVWINKMKWKWFLIQVLKWNWNDPVECFASLNIRSVRAVIFDYYLNSIVIQNRRLHHQSLIEIKRKRRKWSKKEKNEEKSQLNENDRSCFHYYAHFVAPNTKEKKKIEKKK